MGKRSKGKNGKSQSQKSKKKSVLPDQLGLLCEASRQVTRGPLGVKTSKKSKNRTKQYQKDLDVVKKDLAARLSYRGGMNLKPWLRVDRWVVVDPRPVMALQGEIKKLWHGTWVHNFVSISKGGLEPGRAKGMFGRGIYLGGLDKALVYSVFRIPPVLPPEMDPGNHLGVGVLIRCQVALGRVHRAPAAMRYGPLPDYDTIMGVEGKTKSYGGFLLHDEWCVKRKGQVSVLELCVIRPLDVKIQR